MTLKSILKGLAAAAALTLLAGGGALAGEKVKVGFVYVGPVGDHGWTYRHATGGDFRFTSPFGHDYTTSGKPPVAARSP